MDLFTVMTANPRILYCLFLISHELNESHLRRLAQEYIRYYHQDRTHDGLNKDTHLLRSDRHSTGTVASGLDRRLASHAET